MKLKEYNSENCVSLGRTHSPSISINTKTGLIRISVSAANLIGLADGDQVKFHQDEEEESDWYLEKVPSGGFAIREHTGSMIFNNTSLTRKIADSVEFQDKTGKCLVAGKPTEFQKRKLWGVLTSTLRNK